MKRPVIFLTFAAVGFAGDALAPKSDDVAKQYRKTLTRVTEKPVQVDQRFALDCRLSAPRIAGPHSGYSVHYFRDALAQKPGERFAPGSVIVKEKLRPADRGEEMKIDAVAGMIKRAEGTNPKSGGWEFFWSEKGKVTTLGLESCVGCHSGAKRDYVFTDYPKKG